MILTLKELEYGTVFDYNGRMYKLENRNWVCTMVLSTKKDYIGNMQDDYTPAFKVSPKLGGKFQDKIEIWASENLKVNVE